MSILWTILIGFFAGVTAKLLHSGPNEPTGLILTTLLSASEEAHVRHQAARAFREGAPSLIGLSREESI